MPKMYFIILSISVLSSLVYCEKKQKPLNVAESYQLVTTNKYIKQILDHKYADTTINNWIKFDASIKYDVFIGKEEHTYDTYYIYQDQPRLGKIVAIMTLRINIYDKSIHVYDVSKDKFVYLEEWAENNMKKLVSLN